VISNHVMDSTGDFEDSSGSSRGISTESDKQLLLKLRSLADAVIVDAATARSENYRSIAGKKLIIVSQSGDFRDIPAVRTGTGVILATSANIITDSEVSGKHLGHRLPSGNPFVAFSELLQDLGLQRSVLEAGVTLSKLAFEAKLVDRAALTISHQPKQPSFEQLSHPLWPDGKMVSLAEDDSATFTLWTSGGVAAI